MTKFRSNILSASILSISLGFVSSTIASGQSSLWTLEQAIATTSPRFLVLIQGLPPLKPKPGYIIGRVVDRQGRPFTNVELYVAGSTFGMGDPFKEFGGRIAPNVDPRTGYYQLKVPDGIYRVSAGFDKETTAQMGSRIDCLLLDYFKSTDGESPNALYHSKSGIVKDFVWMPSPQDIAKCMR